MVGLADGLPGVTVGPAVVGAPVVGLAVVGVADGLPGVTVGPAVVGVPVVGLAVVGAAVVGLADGLPGVTVGPAVVGAPVVGLAVVGVADGLPGETVGLGVSQPKCAVTTKSSTPALWDSMGWLVSTRKVIDTVSSGNELDGTVSCTRCFLSSSAPKPRSDPCWNVCRSQEMPDSTPLRVTLVLESSISPRSMATPLIST